MGIANLVPGISGGTMLLAVGVYSDFIEAVAALTSLRPRPRHILFLGLVGASAGGGILLLAGPVQDLVVEHRWAMYSVFVGLTLGGMPLLWRQAQPADRATWSGAAAGLLTMVLLTWLQTSGGPGSSSGSGPLMLALAGAGGAASMVLPGISGGYVLLVLGQYVPILGAVERFRVAVAARDLAAAAIPTTTVLLPVAVGLVVGIAVVSNLLRYLLRARRNATLGFLLGLLVGAVVGLWPFQQGVAPAPGDTIRSRLVTPANANSIDPEDWRVVTFRPSTAQLGGSLALLALGATTTLAIARFGERSAKT